MAKFLAIPAMVLALAFTTSASADVNPENVGSKINAGRVHAWSVQYMDGSTTVTSSQAVATASAFDTIVALKKTYAQYVAQMKSANPKLQLFVYVKGIFTYDRSLPESAYSHDRNGNRIQGKQYATWLLDPLSPAALSAQVLVATSFLRQSGYDGVFLDTLGIAALNPEFVKSVPIDPNTGQAWTPLDWVNATGRFAGQLKAAIGKPTIVNGLRDGPNYFDAGSKNLLNSVDGGMAEAWLRGAMNPITRYPSETAWKENVDAVADAGARGSSFLAVTKVWSGGTQAQKDAWYLFTLASFLLGNDGRSSVTFSYTQGDAAVDRPWYHLALGSPSGPYAKVGGVYQRSFARGRVLVNPTQSTFAIDLGGTFHTLTGLLVTAVTLKPETATILTT
jgi:hypothetical protein